MYFGSVRRKIGKKNYLARLCNALQIVKGANPRVIVRLALTHR